MVGPEGTRLGGLDPRILRLNLAGAQAGAGAPPPSPTPDHYCP